MQKHFVVTTSGDRLDKCIASQWPEHSRAEIQRWIEENRVRVNEKVEKASYRVQRGDKIDAELVEASAPSAKPEAIPLTVIYEDDDVLVIDKAAGIVVHPAPGHASGTVVNAVLHHAPDLAGIGGELRPGIVHRLDKDTSGLLLVAKNDLAHRELQRQFKAREVKKVYLALLDGVLTPRQGKIDAPIGRDPRHRQRMAVIEETSHKTARAAVTSYRVQQYFDACTLVEAEPHTGRTHQIRVHFQFIGFPLVGDKVYGRRNGRVECPRQFLHAHHIGFRLPGNQKFVEFVSPLPTDLQLVLDRLTTPLGSDA